MCVDCLFPLHDVQSRTMGINTNGKKGMGGQRVTLSLAQISARNCLQYRVFSLTWSASMQIY